MQYYLCYTIRLAGHRMNIHSMYVQIPLTEYPIWSWRYYGIRWTHKYIWYRRIRQIFSKYSVSVNIGQPDGHSNIEIWYKHISWTWNRYSLGISIGQPDEVCNIISEILLDSPDTEWIFIPCMYGLAWPNIQYDPDDTIVSGEHIVYIVPSDQVDS